MIAARILTRISLALTVVIAALGTMSFWFPLITSQLVLNRGIVDVAWRDLYYSGPYGFIHASAIEPPFTSLTEVLDVPQFRDPLGRWNSARVPLGSLILVLAVATGASALVSRRQRAPSWPELRGLPLTSTRILARGLLVLSTPIVGLAVVSFWFPLITPHIMLNRAIVDVTWGDRYYSGPHGFILAADLAVPWESVTEVFALVSFENSFRARQSARIPLGIPIILLFAAAITVSMMATCPRARRCSQCRTMEIVSQPCARCCKIRTRTNRGRKFLRIAAWLAAILSMLSAIFTLATASLMFEFGARGVAADEIPWLATPVVTAHAGHFAIALDSSAYRTPSFVNGTTHYEWRVSPRPTQRIPTPATKFYPTIAFPPTAPSASFTSPLWPIPAGLALFAWVLFRNSRRVPASRCQLCHYDLTGNTSGRCPECGEPALQSPTLTPRPPAS